MACYIINIICHDFTAILGYQKYGKWSTNRKNSFSKLQTALELYVSSADLKMIGLTLVCTAQLSSPLPLYLLLVWSPGNKAHSHRVLVISLASLLSLLLKYIRVWLHQDILIWIFPLTPMCFLNIFPFPCK